MLYDENARGWPRQNALEAPLRRQRSEVREFVVVELRAQFCQHGTRRVVAHLEHVVEPHVGFTFETQLDKGFNECRECITVSPEFRSSINSRA